MKYATIKYTVTTDNFATIEVPEAMSDREIVERFIDSFNEHIVPVDSRTEKWLKDGIYDDETYVLERPTQIDESKVIRHSEWNPDA
jgi:hypothetical protein